jgi:hypothetical protein
MIEDTGLLARDIAPQIEQPEADMDFPSARGHH